MDSNNTSNSLFV